MSNQFCASVPTVHKSSSQLLSKQKSNMQSVVQSSTHCETNNFQATNVVFDLEENRRRRADLAHDVNELICISKFFQQHFADDFVTRNKSRKTHKKQRQKSATTADSNSSSVTPTKWSRSRSKFSNSLPDVAEVDEIVGQTSASSTTNTEWPPIFDEDKLDDYCENVVDEFFSGNIVTGKVDEKRDNDNVKTEAKPKDIVTAKDTKNRRNLRYASVSARYMRPSPKKSTENIQKGAATARAPLISAKSISILKDVARRGVEIKKHSCSVPEVQTTPKSEARERSVSRNSQVMLQFHKAHPNIDLVPSASVFPRRVLRSETTCGPTLQRSQIHLTSSTEADVKNDDRIDERLFVDVNADAQNDVVAVEQQKQQQRNVSEV